MTESNTKKRPDEMVGEVADVAVAVLRGLSTGPEIGVHGGSLHPGVAWVKPADAESFAGLLESIACLSRDEIEAVAELVRKAGALAEER